MSLARVTLEEPPSVRGAGVNPWRQVGTHSRSRGRLMEKPSRRRRWEQPTASGETAINYRRLYQYVDWSVLVFMASFLALGYAMSSSGLSTVMAHVLPKSLIILFLITAILANFINNVTAAVIMTPIALTYPNPLIAVTVVAMASTTTFLTPFSHPANLLVYNPGGYKPKDYLIAGTLILLLVLIVTMVFTGSLRITI